MDVDLLRPGTVPISSDTVLWFEFLLDPELLQKHLGKEFSDPSPTELITKFYDVITDTLKNKPELDNGDVVNVEQTPAKHSAKNIALKLLSLKVAAHLNWNMNKLRLLPFKTQITLLQDLMYFTNGNISIEIPVMEIGDLDDLSPQYLFSLIVYHRWLLYTTMYRITSNWQLRFGPNDISPNDENYICSPENVEKTVAFLTNALEWKKIIKMVNFECFTLPTERTPEQIDFDWTKCIEVTTKEFATQLNYDLGMFFFYKEEYDSAKKHFGNCMESYEKIGEQKGFLQIDVANLEAYMRACHGTKHEPSGRSLLEQLNSSIFNQYAGITSILQQDNIVREIPLIHRINLELNIQGALSSGTFTATRDLLQKIRALNMVRSILDGKPLYQYANMYPKNIDTIIWAIQITWNSFTHSHQDRIKNYLMELIFRNDVPDLLNKLKLNDNFRNLFDSADLQYIRNAEFTVEVPASLSISDFTALYDFNKKRKPQLELRQLELQLISTNNHVEIRKILTKIQKLNNSSAMWTINPVWELPIPLQSVIKSLQRGFLQDFAFVTLAKSQQYLKNRNWNASLELLIILDKELQSENENIQKLIKLVSWEILLVKVTQLLTEWTNNVGKFFDNQALANACEACLQTSDSILPRTEITEQCILCLLNLRRWEFLINYDKRWSTCEICAAIALACHEIVLNKGLKKLSKNLWDLILPIFLSINSQQSKRGNNHDITTLKTNLMEVFYKLREPIVLAVVISLLTKMFNNLKDEPSLELQVEYTNLWPHVISNANSYSSQSVSELLSEMVLQALKYNPTNVAWLRLMGDINFANNHYRNSLNYYLKSLLIYNEYFNIPIRNDDHVFRRMIKCCTALGCNTQAAVLCQYLEEPDYTLAFRILSDQKTCNDAVDAYYHCFWDTNILEYLIYMHNKKGEFQRRKCAIQVIGLLELNSSNNEEIQREASNLRKSTFLRAMCKQYVL